MSKEGESSDGRMGVWLDMWDNGGMSEFQVNKPHPKIQEHYEFYTSGNPDATLFFPLCGDMHDMVVLGGKGHTIVGVECSETGIKTFFNKNKIEFTEEKCDAVKGKCFKSKDGRYRMYSCDIFDFNKSAEGQFDAILDFGAMTSLKKPDLQGYANVLKGLAKPGCKHLVESFVYDTTKFPDIEPHCFSLDDMQKYFGDKCTVKLFDQGPYPYADMFGESSEAEGGTAGSREGEGEEEFPDFTGANYYLMQPK